MKTVQPTSKSVITKGEKAGTIQLSKYAQTVSKCWDNEDQMPKIANLSKAANDLGWHCSLPKFHLTKYGFNYRIVLE